MAQPVTRFPVGLIALMGITNSASVTLWVGPTVRVESGSRGNKVGTIPAHSTATYCIVVSRLLVIDVSKGAGLNGLNVLIQMVVTKTP